MINKYPYSDMHELNADWLLSKTAELEGRVKELEDSGGGHVSIDPVITSGVKIADYEIGDTQGELYTPESVEDITPFYSIGLDIAEFIKYDGSTGKIYIPTNVLPELFNAGYHNSIYRGNYLGDTINAEQYAEITAGTFKNMFIGDYWTIPTAINGATKNVDYVIAAFDYWWNIGDNFPQGDNRHHVVLVPKDVLYNARMNSTDTTTGGYVGSEMYITNLIDARNGIGNAFSGHIYSVRRLISTGVGADGQANDWAWTTTAVELMSEVMIFGTKIWGNSGFEVGSDFGVLPLFTLNPTSKSIRTNWWLRSIASSSYFALVTGGGGVDFGAASSPRGIRPCFAIYGGN